MSDYRIISPIDLKRLSVDQLFSELKAHKVMAQLRYEQALQAHADGVSSQHLMFLTIIEQNAAMLCSQEVSIMLLFAILSQVDPDDGPSVAALKERVS
ncbi:MAG: hypothetical protein Q8R28_05755 [Dehalococcoidia bacterium]|nr:hypothetical protein [Dehalococcoidia bacterium]